MTADQRARIVAMFGDLRRGMGDDDAVWCIAEIFCSDEKASDPPGHPSGSGCDWESENRAARCAAWRKVVRKVIAAAGP